LPRPQGQTCCDNQSYKKPRTWSHAKQLNQDDNGTTTTNHRREPPNPTMTSKAMRLETHDGTLFSGMLAWTVYDSILQNTKGEQFSSVRKAKHPLRHPATSRSVNVATLEYAYWFSANLVLSPALHTRQTCMQQHKRVHRQAHRTAKHRNNARNTLRYISCS
jgi:hypothetical protein